MKRTSIQPKQRRKSLAHKIFAVSNLYEKLDIALGQSPRFSIFKKPELKDIPAIIRQADFLRHQLVQAKGKTQSELKMLSASMWTFALSMITPIADGDYKFFGSLQAAIQYPKKISLHKRYADIIQFCIGDGYKLCGSADSPCDGLALARYLEMRGHRFSYSYKTEVPRVLRADCKRIGITLR